MKSRAEAVALAEMMVSIGNLSGKNTVAAVTDMSQPLGLAVGNAVEVMEAIQTLRGEGPSDITELSLELAGIMIFLGRKADSPEQGKQQAADAINKGTALEKFSQFVQYQGGNPNIISDERLFLQPETSQELKAGVTGYIGFIDANIIGLASQHTGAGRTVMGEEIDMSAGILLHKKVGDYVTVGECIASIQGRDALKVNAGLKECEKAFTIQQDSPPRHQLIYDIIGI